MSRPKRRKGGKEPGGKPTEPASTDLAQVGDSPVPGMTLQQVLPPHTERINRIAWSPEGQRLALPSGDGAVYVWDVERGEYAAVFEGHEGPVYCAAWSPDGRRLASGSSDETVRIWDVKTSALAQTLEAQGNPRRLDWSPDGERLVGATLDGGIELRDASTGRLVRRIDHSSPMEADARWSPGGGSLAFVTGDGIGVWDSTNGSKLPRLMSGHRNAVCAAWHPDGRRIASAGGGGIAIWDVEGAGRVEVLEGHRGFVCELSFSPGGELLASKDRYTVRIWRCQDWETVAVLQEQGPAAPTALAFHPSRPLLATCDLEHNTIRIWRVDVDMLLGGAAAERVVRYVSAKVVLVGESNVGKSCLAMRLAEGRYPKEDEQGTTHGMRFWPMAPEQLDPRAAAPEGEQRDVVLWDMGGQAEYRLVHQLFLHDTTLALVLLDPTRGRTACDEVEAWNKRLEKQLGGRRAKAPGRRQAG